MDWFGFAISYAVFWWLVLFMVLPMGIRTSEGEGGIAYPAAPVRPRLRRKLLLTSAFALIPSSLLQLGLQMGWFSWVLDRSSSV